MRSPNAKALQRQCDIFNARVPVGSSVDVVKDRGEVIQTVTRSHAIVLSGHTAVIWLEGISGCYLLDRVTLSARQETRHGD